MHSPCKCESLQGYYIIMQLGDILSCQLMDQPPRIMYYRDDANLVHCWSDSEFVNVDRSTCTPQASVKVKGIILSCNWGSRLLVTDEPVEFEKETG